MKIFYPLLFGVVLAIGIAVGFYVSSTSSGKPPLFSSPGVSEFEEILGYINKRYVDTVDTDDLRELAITELFGKLDPHSFYISAEDVQRSNEQLEGNFEGIGIEFNIIRDTIMVVAALANGPSEREGIEAGDRIIKIDDTLVAGNGITNDGVLSKLKGERGSTVKVSVARTGKQELLDFEITRDRIQLNSVIAAHIMEDEVGYVRISQFTSATHSEFVSALKNLRQKGMRSLLIDLRDNGGGYMKAATDIADELIDGTKLLVYTEGRHSPRENIRAHHKGVFEEGPLVVLINEASASASEILAGAVQDLERGTVAGRRSYGKGLVQQPIELSDGGAIRLTTARYYTPKGRSLQRPYDQGNDSYHQDFVNRVTSELNGDSAVQADTVAWGIMPDYYLPFDTLGEFQLLRSLISSGTLPQFCYLYFADHRHLFSEISSLNQFENTYRVSSDVFEQFKDYVAETIPEIPAQDIEEARLVILQGIRAYVAKQLFYMNGFYKMLNKVDEEVLAAQDVLTGSAPAITFSGRQSSAEPR